jgi:DNA-binding SARP family transcriptional activator
MGTNVMLFGSPEINRDGVRSAPDTRKAVAVLAYLAVEGPSVRRDRLAWMLWPESSQERARAALRRTLTSLRIAVGTEGLSSTRETVTLEHGHVSIDTVSFRDAIAAGELVSAEELYRGAFLEGFSLRDAPDFDDWHRLEAESYRTEVDAVLASLASELMGTGDHVRAVDHALRRIELDPLNEEARRSVMLIYARLGRRADAIREYRELVRVLENELAVTPLPDTVELYESIRRGEIPASPQPPYPTPAPQRPTDARFVGRDDELALFDATLDARHGGVIEIHGELGAGKSSLLGEMAMRAGVRNRPTARTRCYEGERGLAFAPTAELLRSALSIEPTDESLRTDVAKLLPEYRRPGDVAPEEPDDGPDARLRLFESWTRALAYANFGGGVVFVDDAHLADAATLDFLAFLASRVDDHNWVLVIASLSPLDLASSGETKIIALGRLDQSPSFTALHGDAAQLGRVVQLDELEPADRQFLEGSAVIARPFSLELIKQIVGRTIDELVVIVDRLLGAEILQLTPGGTIEIGHAGLRNAAYSHASPMRLQLLHQRTAVALESQPHRNGEAARHFELAGQRERAAVLHAAAADDAIGISANKDALAHVRSAIALDHPDRAALHEMAADMATLEGEYTDALRSYETAAAISHGNALAALERKLGLLHLRRGDAVTAASHLESALAELDDEGQELRSRILSAGASAAESSGDLTKARALVAEAVSVAERFGDVRAEATARCIAGLIALAEGDLPRSRLSLRDSLRLAEVARSSPAAAAAHNGLGLVRLEQNEPADAVDHFTASVSLLERLGDRHRLGAALSNLADALHASGRSDEARRAVTRSATVIGQISGDPLDGQPGLWALTSW